MFKIGDRVIRTKSGLDYYRQTGVILSLYGCGSAEILFDVGGIWSCLNGTFELADEDLENV